MSKIELLVKINDIEIFVNPGYVFTEPKLYILEKKELTLITRNSLDFENSYNEFMLDLRLEDKIKEKAQKVINELAIENSQEYIEDWGMLKFTLKEEYAEKIEEMRLNI